MSTPPRHGHEFDFYGLLFVAMLFSLSTAVFMTVQYVIAQTIDEHPDAEKAMEKEQQNSQALEGSITSSTQLEHKDPRFINVQTPEEAVPDEGKFIAANLDSMNLIAYEDGEEVGSYEILSRGEPGSRWDTPSGIYEVSYMNPSHFSSIGDVYMPYSMQFYGNFFIHGWPYYPSGNDVPEGYSGGCIRLSTHDSKEVFEFAEEGTEVFVYEKYDNSEENRDTIQVDPDVLQPSVSARAFLVADLDTGQVYSEQNTNTPLPIASITKLVTALVANETIASERMVLTTSRAAGAPGNSGDLEMGEKMKQSDILYPLLLNSGNDAAYAIADHYGKDYFSFLLNKQARALGMTQTHFDEASGLSSENVSTANDLFALARYIYERKRFLFDITTEESKEIVSTSGGVHTYRNIHPLRNTEGFIGGKNGYIRASRQTLLTLFETNINGQTRNILITVLGAENNVRDTLSLLSWLKDATEN